MSDKIRIFCESVHAKLATLDGRMDSLKLNSGPTCHFLQGKLDEVRERGEAHQPAIRLARIKLARWCDDKESEARNTVDHWRQNRLARELVERAQRAEDHAGYAMQIAEASIDEAERMILEAISARLDAESVGGDDTLTPEIRPLRSCDIMEEEHVFVERVLDLLEQACARIRHGESTPSGFKRWVIGFFFQFADQCRHSKEASTQSPVWQSRGVSSDGGPVGVMLSHHKQGRACIQHMQLAADQRDHVGWALLAEEYTHLLRQQFRHENRVLLQMAEVCGTEEDHGDLAEIFRSANRAQGHIGLSEQFDAQIEQWEQRFWISAHSGRSLVMSAQGRLKDRETKTSFVGLRK